MPLRAKLYVNVRMTEEMIARADTLLPHVANVPELATVARPTRSDVLRICVLRGLAELEAAHYSQPAGAEGRGEPVAATV